MDLPKLPTVLSPQEEVLLQEYRDLAHAASMRRGRAFHKIRNQRLYKATHKSFHAFCRDIARISAQEAECEIFYFLHHSGKLPLPY